MIENSKFPSRFSCAVRIAFDSSLEKIRKYRQDAGGLYRLPLSSSLNKRLPVELQSQLFVVH